MSDLRNQSINDIVAHINKNWFAKPYMYRVYISGSQNLVPNPSEDVMFNCSQATIPGINISLFQDSRFGGIGMREFFGHVKTYAELNLSFYESEAESEREYFVRWIEKIYNRQTKRINYKKDYVKNITIEQWNKKGKKVAEFLIKDAFPSNVAPLDRGYASGDQVPQFVVNFQFGDCEEIYYGTV